MAMLIAEGQPDAEGHVIPSGTKEGSAQFASAKGRNESITLIVAGGIYDVSTATCGASCTTCCGVSNFGITPNPIYCPVGETMPCSTNTTDCNGWPVMPSSWGSSDTSVMTVDGSGVVTGVAPGSAAISAYYGNLIEYTGQFCGGPYCPSGTPAPSAQGSVYSISITDADLENNNVNVTISGPTGPTSVLTVTANGTSNNVQVSANNGTAVGPGSYSVSFDRPSMAVDTYTKITASWDQMSTSVTLARKWDVKGLFRHSQYNTPSESACTGTPTAAWVFTSSCTFTQTTLRSDFMSQVVVNGSGVSVNNGPLHYEPPTVCSSSRPQGSTDQNSFELVSAITGSCGTAVSAGVNGTVAVYPNPAVAGGPYVCGDNTLEVTSANTNNGLKTVADFCPGCNTGFLGTLGHIDDYSSSQACSAHAVGDLGNFWTADTH